MLGIISKIPRALPKGSLVPTCDNSGAKIVRIISVKNLKTVKGRVQSARVGDLVTVAVIKGRPDMRKQVVFGVVVRQKKEFSRANGTKVKFESNAVVILKDEKGNPKGTMIKGAIAKEVVKRWPMVSKIASVIV